MYSKPNIATVTANTYERQIRLYLCPAFKGKTIEEITAVDVQKLFNGMNCAKATKIKARNVLSMIMQNAVEMGIIDKNCVQFKSIRIQGTSSKVTEPYTVEQMRYLAGHLDSIEKPLDKTYIALQAFHPFRPEEVLGLKWKDIDLQNCKVHIERAVTHPLRNQPEVKDTKTEESRRCIDLVKQIVPYLQPDAPEDFVLGGKKPLSYTQVRRMCKRIEKDIGFDESIVPNRFRPTVLTDIYAATKDAKRTQIAAGHTTMTTTFTHYIHARSDNADTASPIANTYGLA